MHDSLYTEYNDTPKQFKIRTITQFVPDQILNDYGQAEQLKTLISDSASFLQQCKYVYEEKGYAVQTVRIATRVLQHLQDPQEALPTATALEKCCLDNGITFLSLGSTGNNGNAFLSNPGTIASLAASLTHTSFTVSWLAGWGLSQAKALAAEIFQMAELTNGAANFRFSVSFNCPSGIPFFPAAEAPPQNGPTFALGIENSGLLHQAFSFSAAQWPKVQEEVRCKTSDSLLNFARDNLKDLLSHAFKPLETIAQEVASTPASVEDGSRANRFLGIDTSIAPALEPPTIPEAFQSLGIGPFGGSGTLAITERITSALKNVEVRKTGYCGLMLPVCEDVDLAKAAAEGKISIQTLLHYSAVCGVGLDTVPVPGPGPETSAAEREELLSRAAAVLLDVAALSNRLDKKPLSVRLLPVVGGVEGHATAFNNLYLVESKVMAL